MTAAAGPKFPAGLHRRFHRPARMQLMIVPLIDIVFLLLVFFLLTASFRPLEAFLPAELPRRAAGAEPMELDPLALRVDTTDDGTCAVRIGNEKTVRIARGDSAGGFDALAGEILAVLRRQNRTVDDPVKLAPTRRTPWDHVVKVYHCLWQLNLTNVIFVIDKQPSE